MTTTCCSSHQARDEEVGSWKEFKEVYMEMFLEPHIRARSEASARSTFDECRACFTISRMDFKIPE